MTKIKNFLKPYFGVYVALIIFSFLIFGYSMFGGRPLTMHEARLPQIAREMTANNNLADYLVPKSGGRPWVERPPLPAWLMLTLTMPLGGIHHEWQARFPAALMGVLGVCLICALATRMFDKKIGILAGFIQATTFEYLSYAWLSEDDIFLCVLLYGIWLTFITMERRGDDEKTTGNFFAQRDTKFYLLFALLGLTNVIKGVIFGTIIALIPIAGYLLWQFNWQHLRRYIWFWGGLIFLLIASAWAVTAEMLTPVSWRVWHFDLCGRLTQGYLPQPWYYYAENLPGMLAPWLPLGIVGISVLFRKLAQTKRPQGYEISAFAPVKFLLVWAILPPLVLSISDSKHHHYLLANTGAWAILSACGLRWLWEKITANLTRWRRYATSLFTATILLLTLGAFYLHSRILPLNDGTAADTFFLHEVHNYLPPNARLFINARGSLEFFRNLFYAPNGAILIHDLPFLADEKRALRGQEIYLLDRVSRREKIAEYGEVTELLQSTNSRRAAEHGGNFALFKVKIRADLPPTKLLPITPMQAMERD